MSKKLFSSKKTYRKLQKHDRRLRTPKIKKLSLLQVIFRSLFFISVAVGLTAFSYVQIENKIHSHKSIISFYISSQTVQAEKIRKENYETASTASVAAEALPEKAIVDNAEIILGESQEKTLENDSSVIQKKDRFLEEDENNVEDIDSVNIGKAVILGAENEKQETIAADVEAIISEKKTGDLQYQNSSVNETKNTSSKHDLEEAENADNSQTNLNSTVENITSNISDSADDETFEVEKNIENQVTQELSKSQKIEVEKTSIEPEKQKLAALSKSENVKSESFVQPLSCQINEVKKLTKETAIYFGLGNKNISDQGKDDIKRLAAEVDNCPDVRIEIAGHSDSLGLDGINFELSWQRAEAVNDLIKGLGYDNSSYITVGYGARRPAKKIKIPAIVKTVFVVKKEEAQSTKEQTENTENTEPKSEELALQKEKSERRRKLRLEYIRRNSVNRRVEFNLR